MAIPSILLLLSTITVVVMSTLVPHKPTDTDSLTIFRSRADAHGNLASNWSTQDACSGHWRGVRCSPSGLRVISLSLPALDLRGPLDALTHLHSLRLLDLHSNRINGTLLPLLSSLSDLRFLYLSSNDLSGPIPPTIGRLTRLRRLDLSGNDLTGPIPPEISNLTRLLTLRLHDNLLSGPVLDLSALLLLADFNASNNQLEGTAPDGMIAKFGMASLAGNAGLCNRHESSCSSQSVVPSNPGSMPAGGSNVAAAATNRGPYHDESKEEEEEGRLSRGTVIAIITGNSVFLLVVILCFLAAYCCCNHRGRHSGQVDQDEDAFKKVMMVTKAAGGECRKSREEVEEESEGGGGAEGRSKMVFFATTPGTKNMTRRPEFDLDELLRASAEMVGKGSLGTVYRAVLEDGMTVVAVKRLRDANPCSRKEFHRYMDLIGRLRHPNLVSLRAYYFANQEKLLVYDFLPNGSLHTLLHLHRAAAGGNPGRIPVDWAMRIRLTLGAARGLSHIHEMYSSASGCIPHGNVRSSNVLLDKKGSACISDFGLALLLSPAQATARLGGYGAPEQQGGGGGRLSQEADVYAFGVLLLEVLTGRIPDPPQPLAKAPVSLPEWVRSVVREEWTAEVFDPELMRYYKKNVEEEMVAMLHVALACVAEQPNQRPTMREVGRMIQDIRTEQSLLPEEEDSDVASSASPSVGATTEGEEEEGEGRLSYC